LPLDLPSSGFLFGPTTSTCAIFATRRVKLARIEHECDMRTASYCAALEQIGKVYDLSGVFP